MASSFANKDAQWWILPGGSSSNGGGFDATVSGAGTNYANQNSAQLTLTDLATTAASAVVTSITGGFTAAMVGNIMRIPSGTNFTADYYVITAYTSTNSVTLDRNCTTGVGSGGACSVGGAHAAIGQYSIGGTATDCTPALASPLIGGNTVNIGGSGNLDGATADYNWSSGFYEFPGGSYLTTSGSIKWIGFNGRPYIKHCGLLSFQSNGTTQGNSYWIKHCKFYQSVATWTTHACFDSTVTSFYDCIFDVAGIDAQVSKFGNGSNQSGSMICCEIRNSGGGAAATDNFGIENTHGGCLSFGNWIHGLRSHGITGVGVFGSVFNCIIANNGGYGYNDYETDGALPIPLTFMNNTFDNNGLGAMNFASYGIANHTIINNIFSNSPLALSYADSLQVNTERYKYLISYNNYYNNTANFNSISSVPTWSLNPTVDAGLSGDLTVNPQYVNASVGNYTTGANVANKGLAACSNFTSTASVINIGAMI